MNLKYIEFVHLATPQQQKYIFLNIAYTKYTRACPTITIYLVGAKESLI